MLVARCQQVDRRAQAYGSSPACAANADIDERLACGRRRSVIIGLLPLLTPRARIFAAGDSLALSSTYEAEPDCRRANFATAAALSYFRFSPRRFFSDGNTSPEHTAYAQRASRAFVNAALIRPKRAAFGIRLHAIAFGCALNARYCSYVCDDGLPRTHNTPESAACPSR